MSQDAPPDTHGSTTTSPLGERYDLTDGQVHLTGLQALVRLPMDLRRADANRGIDSGVFISGYEGSPLAGLDLELSRQADRFRERGGVVFQPAVNEELAANAVQGSQLASASADRIGDGVVGIWYGKAPGLDRATDAIRHSNLGGTDPRGGVLALVGDDSAAKSSTVPSSSEAAIAELGMPCLSPADPQDILDLGVHGVAMSRVCGLWVAMKLATNVVDGSSTVHVDAHRVQPVQPDRSFDGEEFVHEVTGHLLQPVLGQLEATQVNQRLKLAQRYAVANHLNRFEGDPAAPIGVVCAGATYLEVRQALSEMGITEATISTSGLRLLKLGMIHPLEPEIIARFADGLTEIVVVEEKKPFLELALKDLLYGTEHAPRIYGKHREAGTELFRAHGDLPADYIAPRLAARIRDTAGTGSVIEWLAQQRNTLRLPVLPPVLPRTPYFCSGCPHSSSTKVPEGSLMGAGIGCHAMVNLMPTERVGETIGLAQMGGEGAAWIGMSPFVARDHLIQNLGDGTFHHSGSLAIRAALAAGVRITYKLLYNDAVAMTGGQQAIGKMAVPEVVAALRAEGVTRIVITSDDPKGSRRAFGPGRLPREVEVRHRDDLIEVQQELSELDGVTVLIHQQECATELRRKRKRGLVESPKARVLINERVCEGCGDCGDTSNCLSVQPVETEFGRKTQIHQGSCNLDFSCLKGDCPSFLEVIPADDPQPSEAYLPTVDTSALPEPRRLVSADDFSMRITGIGGTGIVTVAQVIAAASSRAGLHVKGLDQLGLAQKGGAVVSDIRMSNSKIVGSNKVSMGRCDLYLGCDILVAAAEKNLEVMSSDRTFAVVSTAVSPTGDMVTDITSEFPDRDSLLERIQWAGARPENVFVDARQQTQKLLHNDQYANIYLLGVAVQAGVLPLAPEDVEWALDLNGVQVERNVLAFRLGRRFVVDRDTGSSGTADGDGAAEVRAARLDAITSIVDADDGSALADLVHRRVDELARYQNPRYARRYATEVESVRAAEAAKLGESTELTEEFARHLYKVMAYKDEYEVARLHLDPALETQMREQFGPGARYSILLHPLILRAMGLKRKVRLQSWWAKPALRMLYAMRFVRGTRFDLFGYDNVRREERRLVEDYLRVMSAAMDDLSEANVDLVHELARLPDVVRGYEDIKLRTLDKYRSRRNEILEQLKLRGVDRS